MGFKLDRFEKNEVILFSVEEGYSTICDWIIVPGKAWM
jgi:hypothetical protein